MLNIKKGAFIAMTVAGSLALAGCMGQGTGSAACGDTTATPVAAPAPSAAPAPVDYKSANACKSTVKKHHHKRYAKKMMKKDDSSTNTTETTATETQQ